jgi:hypothetical protein
MAIPDILYKFREIGEYTEDILCNKRLFFPSWDKLNDPHEARICVKKPDENTWYSMHPSQLKDIGGPVECHEAFVCSLSRRWNSNLLWSHYAGGHKGIAIGIDMSSLSHHVEIIDVFYDNKIPIFKPPVTKNTLKKSLKQKSKEWMYEDEVRLVSFEESFKYLENITIKEVLFGMKTSDEHKYQVIDKLREDNVNFFDVRPGQRKYDLLRHPGVRERLFKFHSRNEK